MIHDYHLTLVSYTFSFGVIFVGFNFLLYNLIFFFLTFIISIRVMFLFSFELLLACGWLLWRIYFVCFPIISSCIPTLGVTDSFC